MLKKVKKHSKQIFLKIGNSVKKMQFLKNGSLWNLETPLFGKICLFWYRKI